MNQTELFPSVATVNRALEYPISKRSNPQTSKDAATHITESGKREGQLLAVLALVRSCPGKTSAELAWLEHNLDRYQIARRLPELESAKLVAKGEVKTCGVTGRRAHTWVPV